MKNVLIAFKGLALSGIAFFFFAYSSLHHETMAMLVNENRTHIVSDLLKIDEQKRLRGSGPKVYVYLTEHTSIFVKSLSPLKIGDKINCIEYKDECFDIGSGSPINFKPTKHLVGIVGGIIMCLLALIIWIFRFRFVAFNESQDNGI
jgi:hypothetical protein